MNEQLIARYNELSKRRQEALTKQIELKATLNHHRTEYNTLMDQLKSQFKVSSLKEGYSLQEEMETRLNTELDALNKALDDYDNLLRGDPK